MESQWNVPGCLHSVKFTPSLNPPAALILSRIAACAVNTCVTLRQLLAVFPLLHGKAAKS